LFWGFTGGGGRLAWAVGVGETVMAMLMVMGAKRVDNYQLWVVFAE
jgi:hypothetical protein